MTERRTWIKAAVFGFLVVTLLYNGVVMAIDPADSIRNTSISNGIVSLEVRMEPAAVQAGDTVTLEIIAINRGTQASLISARSLLPNNLQYDTSQVPASTSFNYQLNQFTWQPVVPAGQMRQFTLPMTVSVADLTQPMQMVQVDVQNGGILEQLSAEFWVGTPPTAEIIAPDTIAIGQSIQLYANVQGPGPFAQQWQTSDGRTIRAADPQLSFATAGEHTVELSVENPVGRITTSKTISVTSEPVTLFSLDDLTPGVNQALRFVNASGGAMPMQYRWDFGDGIISAEREPIHRYSEPGTYQVTLETRNTHGSSEMTVAITVGEPPSASMRLPGRIKVGEQLLGEAFGDQTITNFEWRMGDGRTTAGENLNYIYTQPGVYTVALIAHNPFGATQLEQQIEVEEGILNTFFPIVMNLFQPPSAELLEAEAEKYENFNPIDLERDVAPLDSSQEERLLWYVNKARETNGLPPLRYNENLSIAAKRHTNDMAFNRFTAHTGSDGSHPFERQIAAGYGGGYAGEATAWGFEFPSGSVMFWLQSPSHRPLLLNAEANEAGVAFTYDETAPSVYYWTVEFGNSSGAYSSPFGGVVAPTPTPPILIPTSPPPVAVNEPVIVVVPQDTPTPIIVVEEPEPTVEPTAPPVVVITVTATTVVSKPAALPLPTYTSTPIPTQTLTPTPTHIPTAVPTATPEDALIVTSTPLPTETPTETPTPAPPTATPTMTLEPRVDPTKPPIMLPTETPTPQPGGEEESAASPTVEQITAQFIGNLLADPSGVTALSQATYGMQAQLLTADALAVLQFPVMPTSFNVTSAVITVEQTSAEATVQFVLPDGSTPLRRILLQYVQDQWRVNAIVQ